MQEYCRERGEKEKRCKDNSKIEERFFCAPTGVKADIRARPSQHLRESCACLLEQDCCYKENGDANLEIRQYGRKHGHVDYLYPTLLSRAIVDNSVFLCLYYGQKLEMLELQ